MVPRCPPPWHEKSTRDFVTEMAERMITFILFPRRNNEDILRADNIQPTNQPTSSSSEHVCRGCGLNTRCDVVGPVHHVKLAFNNKPMYSNVAGSGFKAAISKVGDIFPVSIQSIRGGY